MGRRFVVPGATMVRVKGGGHLPPPLHQHAANLGLTSESISITPRFVHQDLPVDDFGPTIPPEVMAMMADCTINMTLVHYDPDLLNICVQEANGGGNGVYTNDGSLAPGGRLLGNNRPMYASGNHYMAVSLVSVSVLEQRWRFKSCYLNAQPLEIPVGTERTLVKLSWRAIPYVPMNANGEVLSVSGRLWDRVPDPLV